MTIARLFTHNSNQKTQKFTVSFPEGERKRWEKKFSSQHPRDRCKQPEYQIGWTFNDGERIEAPYKKINPKFLNICLREWTNPKFRRKKQLA